MTLDEVYRFVEKRRLAVLSTVTVEGQPQSALVGFAATPGMELIFDTVRSSRKYANLKARADCSFVVGWDEEVTVQYEGVAEELEGDLLQRMQSVYFKKWPECVPHLKWPGITYFLVRPRWIRTSDFGGSEPSIAEIRL